MKKYGVVISFAIIGAGAAGWYYYAKKQDLETAEKQFVDSKTTATSSEISLSPLSICKVLDKAVEFLNISPEQITPVNGKQQAFLTTDYPVYRRHMKKDLFAPDELKAYVGSDAETLNKILRDNGFTIQLKKFSGSDSIGVVAIQNILVKWLEKAEQKPIHSGRNEYTGFHLDEDQMNVSFSGNDRDNPTVIIAEIATKSGDKLYCAVKVKVTDGKTVTASFFTAEKSLNDSDTMHEIDSLREQLKNKSKYAPIDRYNAIELPMISYQEKPSIEWLSNLQFPGYTVTQALQEVIFKMNNTGAQAKAAVAIQLLITASLFSSPEPLPKETLIVNQPFLLWIERPGMPLPIFAAYLEQKYWSDPGSIED